MTNSKTVTIYWQAGLSENESLASKIACLVKKVDDVTYSYLEWRPGSGLLNPEAGSAPILINGPPEDIPTVEIDELRLFGKESGLHAIEERGTTRWMHWYVNNTQSADKIDGWEVVKAIMEEHPIAMLDKPGASRFGIEAALGDPQLMTIKEYRVGGSLLTWTLQRSNRE